jgi:hypothetical protein
MTNGKNLIERVFRAIATLNETAVFLLTGRVTVSICRNEDAAARRQRWRLPLSGNEWGALWT